MYSAKTFNWGAFYGQLRHTIEDITGFDGKHVIMDYSTNKVDYPYVTVSAFNESGNLAESYYSKEQEVLSGIIQINCYSSNGNDVLQMRDDIATLLFDPIYRNKFHQYGAVLRGISNNSSSASDFSGLFNVSSQSITLNVDIYRDYVSKIQEITNFDDTNSK